MQARIKYQMRNRSYHKLNFVDDSRPNFHLRTFKREHLISHKMFDSLAAESLNIKGVLFLRDATLFLEMTSSTQIVPFCVTGHLIYSALNN